MLIAIVFGLGLIAYGCHGYKWPTSKHAARSTSGGQLLPISILHFLLSSDDYLLSAYWSLSLRRTANSGVPLCSVISVIR